MEKGNFEKSFRVLNIVLGFAGIQIFPKKFERGIWKLIKQYIFWFNLTCLCLVLAGELCCIIEGIYMRQRFEDLFTTAPCFTISILAIVKFDYLYFNRIVVTNIIEKLKTIHLVDNEEELDNAKEERRIRKNALKFLNITITFFSYLCATVVVFFSIAPALSMAYDKITMGSAEFKLPLCTKYFFELSTMSRWAVVYVNQIWAMLVASTSLFSTDTLFYALCTYIEMHFQLLCLQFENVVSEDNKAKTRANFRKAARRHQDLIELVEQIELLYSKSTLCNFILSSLLICFSGFVVTCVDDITAVTTFVTFLVMTLAQISLLCFFGEMLSSASIQISQAVYNSSWYDVESDIKNSLFIVIIRAQKPCKVTAMKFADLNLNALSAILKTSWSYFALLKTMYD